MEEPDAGGSEAAGVRIAPGLPAVFFAGLAYRPDERRRNRHEAHVRRYHEHHHETIFQQFAAVFQ